MLSNTKTMGSRHSPADRWRLSDITVRQGFSIWVFCLVVLLGATGWAVPAAGEPPRCAHEFGVCCVGNGREACQNRLLKKTARVRAHECPPAACRVGRDSRLFMSFALA